LATEAAMIARWQHRIQKWLYIYTNVLNTQHFFSSMDRMGFRIDIIQLLNDFKKVIHIKIYKTPPCKVLLLKSLICRRSNSLKKHSRRK